MHQKRRMKAAALLLLALLAACGSGKAGGNGAAAAKDEATIAAPAATATTEADDRIECAVDGAAFARACTLERAAGPDGLVLTVHAPSGGFRRLLVTKDGRGVAAADGAEPAKVTVLGPGRIEVAIGGDRYRLPATVTP
jgi:glucose/arabinose dehydrogenase